MSDAPPELTRLVKRVHTSPSGVRTLTVAFLVSTQQLLLEDFEAAAHDAVLRHAHADGHMPVGPILIRTQPAESEQLGVECELCQGKGWLFEQAEQDCPDCTGGRIKPRPQAFRVKSLEEMEVENRIMAGDLIQVYADVELGLSI